MKIKGCDYFCYIVALPQSFWKFTLKTYVTTIKYLFSVLKNNSINLGSVSTLLTNNSFLSASVPKALSNVDSREFFAPNKRRKFALTLANITGAKYLS